MSDTPLRQDLILLQEEILWYKNALEFAGIGVYKWERQKDQWHWSDKVYEIRGFSKDPSYANPVDFYAQVHPDDRAMLLAAELDCKNGTVPLNVEYRFLWPSGELRWHRELANMLCDGQGEPALMCGVVIDITEEKRRMAQLALIAQTDPLTGLANRAAFDRWLAHHIPQTPDPHNAVLLAFIDLNGFKSINDRFGHAAGDQILRQVAAGLTAHCAEPWLVARLGGDEFGVLACLPTATLDVQREALKQTLVAVFTQMAQEAGEWAVGAAIGLSCYPRDATTAKLLLSQADAAMYAAKRTGQRIVVCDFRA